MKFEKSAVTTITATTTLTLTKTQYSDFLNRCRQIRAYNDQCEPTEQFARFLPSLLMAIPSVTDVSGFEREIIVTRTYDEDDGHQIWWTIEQTIESFINAGSNT